MSETTKPRSYKPEELDAWFTYHAPTATTAPLFERVNAAWLEALNTCLGRRDPPTFDTINAACRAFVVAIDESAPPCADTSAALRCVRLARNAANEKITGRGRQPWDQELARIVEAELAKARWQANAAIAIGVK